MRRSTAVAGLWVISIAILPVVVMLSAGNGSLGETVIFVLIAVVYSSIGAMIVARTGNRIGWLLSTVGLAFPLGTLMEQWAIYGNETCPGCVPVIDLFLIPGQVVWMTGTVALLHIFVLFPSGRFAQPRDRLLSQIFLSAMAINVVTLILRPSDQDAPYQNPYGIGSARVLLLVIFGAALIVALASAAIGVVRLFSRFRHSTGIERQQVRWIASVGVLSAVLLVFSLALSAVMPGLDSIVGDLIWLGFFSVLMLGVPVAVGMAVMRYRLFDIDRIISRTVSYVSVTAILVGLYAVIAVVIPATLLSSSDSDVPIAVGTIVVAAAFGPVRRRIQNVVDRRFNRARYDAARTLATFNAHMRTEVDIDALGAELRGVVGRTMQPSHASLWLKPVGNPRR